jgi:hypothetical protein
MTAAIPAILPSASRSRATLNSIDSRRPSRWAAGTLSRVSPYFVTPVAMVLS